MTTISFSMLVTDAQKDGVVSAINTLTPEYTVGFSRKVCADDPGVTWETPASHWYTNGSSIDASIVAEWQDAIAAAGVEDALHGVVIFTIQQPDPDFDYLNWATINLGSKGLRLVPDPDW
jgi:hypothetical protein